MQGKPRTQPRECAHHRNASPLLHSAAHLKLRRRLPQTLLLVWILQATLVGSSSAQPPFGQEGGSFTEQSPRAEQNPRPSTNQRNERQSSPSDWNVRGPATAENSGDLNSVEVPLAGPEVSEHTVITSEEEDHVTLVIRGEELSAVLITMAEHLGKNIVTSADVTGNVSVTLNNVRYENALDAILHVHGFRWVKKIVQHRDHATGRMVPREIILVSKMQKLEAPLSPDVDGRELRVFRLDFISALDVEKTVKGLLSPLGNAFVTEIDSTDRRKHREELVVEDIPEYLSRIEAYIAQADQPPSQVLIEAHVLQVNLKDDNRHGVDIRNIANLANAEITLQNNGIANIAANPAFLLNVDGRRVDSIIEVLQGTTDSKTLASPKVLAVNGQEARIQIGESLGYLTTTTTQTASVQTANFLDLGVVLSVTPQISRDGRILMQVKPEVSSGRINNVTGLPDSETTEVESTVMLPNGHAMVIGGLIKEENTDQQSKLPIAGDIPVLGKLFQRRNRVRSRNEIIIVLLPRIVPYGDLAQARHAEEVQRGTTPLFDKALAPVVRTQYEPRLPNANQYCEPIGRNMNCFPTPPVAYSPYNDSYYGEHMETVPLINDSLDGLPPSIPQTVPQQAAPLQTVPPLAPPPVGAIPSNDTARRTESVPELPAVLGPIRQASGSFSRPRRSSSSGGWRKSRAPK